MHYLKEISIFKIFFSLKTLKLIFETGSETDLESTNVPEKKNRVTKIEIRNLTSISCTKKALKNIEMRVRILKKKILRLVLH